MQKYAVTAYILVGFHAIMGKMGNKTEKKKILYIITKAKPFGGAQKYVLDLATHFKEGGADVVVALGAPAEASAQADKTNLFTEKLKEAHIPAIFIKHLARDISLFSDALAFFSLLRAIWSEKPHIIHLNSSKAGGVGALAARIYNAAAWFTKVLHTSYTLHATRIIFTAHGWAFREDRPPWQRAFLAVSSWFTILFSHQIIAVSKNDKRAVSSWLFTGKKVGYIHNGARFKRHSSRANARKEISDTAGKNIPEEATWVGTIAELTKNKGLGYALEAIAQLPKETPVAYIIIGAGEDRELLQGKIEDLGIADRAYVLGTDFEGEASSYLRAFDIFLLPSIKEGLPYTLIEAGFVGLPVVATTVGGIPEIIADMKSGVLVRPKQPSEISEAIRFLIEYKKRAKAFGTELKAHIENSFSREQMIEKTKQVYFS